MGIALLFAEVAVIVVLAAMFIREVVFPLIDGRMLFPSFRGAVKALDRREIELNQEEYELNRLSAIEKKEEKIGNKSDR